MTIYSHIKKSIVEGERLLAVLIDPDKTELDTIEGIVTKINQDTRVKIAHIF